MRKIVLSVEAAADIDRVVDFLATKSQEAANRAYLAIADQLEKIMTHPTIYRPIEGVDRQREAVLSFGTHGYVVRYRFDQEADLVTILKVWHHREDRN